MKRRIALGRRVSTWLGHQAVIMPEATLIRTSTSSPSAAPTPSNAEIEFQELNARLDDPHGDHVQAYGGDDDDDDNDEGGGGGGREGEFEDPEAYPLGVRAEQLPLLLPSELPPDVTCSAQLADKELRLRRGRLEAYLTDARRLLRIKQSVYRHKEANDVGQVPRTRSNRLMNEYLLKIQQIRVHYQAERASAVRLDPDGPWQNRLKILNKVDLRPPNEDEPSKKSQSAKSLRGGVWKEGQKSISWIWKMPLLRAGEDGNAEVASGDEEAQVGEGE
jgi:hypothetical protein